MVPQVHISVRLIVRDAHVWRCDCVRQCASTYARTHIPIVVHIYTDTHTQHVPVTCYLIGLGTSINFFIEVFGRAFNILLGKKVCF